MDGTGTVKTFLATKVKAIIKGVLIGLVSSFLALVIFSAVMLWFSLPISWVNVFAYVAAALGGLASGFITGVLLGEKGLIFGGIAGVSLFLITFIIGALAQMHIPEMGVSVLSLAITVASSALGGVIGVNRK